MARNEVLDFANDFEAPVVKARLNALLLLARSVRVYLTDLFRETEAERDKAEWHQVLTVLAKTFAGQIGTINETTEVILIWNQFSNSTIVARLGPRSKHVLNLMLEHLNESLKVADGAAIDYLTEANQRAALYVRSLAERHKFANAAAVSVVPVFVYFDPKAELFCASTARLAGRICWGLQLKEYSFYEVLILDWVFEHEYLSHLLPQNKYLSRSVREIWLTSVLREEHHNVSPERHTALFLWEKFRHELAMHFHASSDELFGPARMDLLTAKIFFYSPVLFWELTSDILSLDDDPEKAELVDAVLSKFSGIRNVYLRRVLSERWRGFQAMLELVTRISD